MINDVNADGSNSIAAGRDINVLVQQYLMQLEGDGSDLINRLLAAQDTRVGRIYPKGVVPSNGITPTPFHSNVLLDSLTSIGMPTVDALKVLDGVVNTLVNGEHDDDNISASYLRKIITDALRRYEADKYSEEKFVSWVEKYIRAYGDPNHPIEVVLLNGTCVRLEYNMLLNEVIPELIEQIRTNTKYENFIQHVSVAECRKMAGLILTAVKGLHLYRIHYVALVSLARELATQPPTPWLMPLAHDMKAVDFIYTRMNSFWDRALASRQCGDIDLAMNLSRDAIHFATASILTYYGGFMGCGEHSSLLALKQLLGELDQLSNHEDHYAEIQELHHDINKLDITLHEVRQIVARVVDIKDIGPKANSEMLNTYWNRVSKLMSFTKLLLASKVVMNELAESWRDIDNIVAFSNASEMLVSAIPTCTVVEKKKNHMWVSHSLKPLTALGVSQLVLIRYVYQQKEGHHNSISVCSRLLEKLDAANAFLIISNTEVNAQDRSMLLRLIKQGYYGAILTLGQIIEVLKFGDAEAELVNLLRYARPAPRCGRASQ